ncbi:MAG: hypothetical protein HKO70_17165, partial [Acidimicrobiia bacterium]|nr:hypothetical protein [Acidimicrobiia bacterium]
LPPLDIAFHDHRSGCDGHPGLFRLVDGVADIEVCDWTDHTILHELGHAWVASHVDDEIRAALVAYWGLETWNDQTVSWGLRANERAAESIALALSPLPPRIAPVLIDHLCAYSLLTENSVHPHVAGSCPDVDGRQSTTVAPVW